MLIRPYDVFGFVFLVMGAVLAFLLSQVWSDVSFFGKGAGLATSVAALTAGVVLNSLGRNNRIQQIAFGIFAIAVVVVIVFRYVYIVIPGVGQHTGWW